MKNGNTEHDLDSIAQLVRRQNATLDVVMRHLAFTEASVLALIPKTLPDESLYSAKRMKDLLQLLIHEQMIDEVERNLDRLSNA